MSNISYILLFVISVFFAIIGVNIIYVYDMGVNQFNTLLVVYIVMSFITYFSALRIFQPISLRALSGGGIFLIIFTFIPLLIGLMERIECVVEKIFPLFGLGDDVQTRFLNVFEVHIYIVVASLLSLSVTWLYDFSLGLIRK